MSYIAYAWLTSIAYGLAAIVGKVATKHHIKNPWLFNFLWGLMTIVLILPLALWNGVSWPQHLPSMMWLSVANAVSGILFVLAFYAVDLSVLSPLSSVRTPLLAIVGVAFLSESLSPAQWVLIGIIFIAGLWVNIDERFSIKAILNKNTAIAFVWILASVWFSSMIKYASAYNGFWEVSLWSSVIGQIFLFFTIPLWYQDFLRTKVRQYSGLAVSTVFNTAGLLFSIKAFGENVALSTAIISLPLSMLMTMALAKLKPTLLEKHTNSVYAIRLVSATVMVIAALGLSQ